MKRLVMLVLVLVGAAMTGTLLGQDIRAAADQQEADRATNARQALFKVIAWHMEPVGEMMRGTREFSPEVVQQQATRIEEAARMIPEVFAYDTREFQVDSTARANIWTNFSNFSNIADNLAERARELREIAEAEDAQRLPTLRAAGAMGQVCGNCHDLYRVD